MFVEPKVLISSAHGPGSLGVAEILAGKAARQDDVAALQREDLASLGQLMLQLLCGSVQHPSLEQCAMYFSQDLAHIVASLLGHSQEPIVSWHQARDSFALWEGP